MVIEVRGSFEVVLPAILTFFKLMSCSDIMDTFMSRIEEETLVLTAWDLADRDVATPTIMLSVQMGLAFGGLVKHTWHITKVASIC